MALSLCGTCASASRGACRCCIRNGVEINIASRLARVREKVVEPKPATLCHAMSRQLSPHPAFPEIP